VTGVERTLVTVVIPTHRRPAELRRCLEAATAQESPFPFEVIVVDDGGTLGTGAPEPSSTRIPVRVLRVPHGGPARARNAGAAAARGEIVCFVDDDCVPAPGWLEAIVAPVREGRAQVVAGPTVNASPRDRVAEASQYVTNFLAAPGGDGTLAFAPTSNICCTRAVLEGVPFDDGFPAAAGEDRDWCARLAETGHAIRFAERAVVAHHQRLDLHAFVRQHARYGRGGYDFRSRHGGARRLARPGFYLRLVGGAFRSGASVGALVLLAQLANTAGYAAAAIAARRPART
jgi:glycosyltransferase involved in cell wall biosynthesis